MDYNMIVSGLALLAATANLFLHLREKKRNEKRNTAMIDYIGAECKAVAMAAEARLNERIPDSEAVEKKISEVQKKVEEIGENVMDASGKFQDQLGQTLSSIMSFDPVAAQRKARTKDTYGWEDK